MSGVLCYCNSCTGPDDDENYTCQLTLGGQCYSSIREEYNKEDEVLESVRSYGCFSGTDNALLQCKGDLVPSENLQSVLCCNFTDYCNKNLQPELKPRHVVQPNIQTNLLFWTVSILTFMILVGCFLYALIFCFKHLKKKVSRKCLMKYDLASSTGSGAGNPLLVQRTIGRQFIRIYCLGRGRFAEVNVGEWNASKIAEKIFSTNEEKHWLQEKKIYETALLQHKNVLGYITSDILESGLRAIYTEYHQLGSLHDYLDKTCLNVLDFLKLIESATTAISYLHTEILGTTKLPPVAHRDITSKNFLISNSKECVISNFEIAVMPISANEDTVVDVDITQGTPRYMAPEVVNGTIKLDSFAAFKMADIYSLGLVLYEICQRFVTVEGNVYTVDDHTLPFFDVLPKNPSMRNMADLFASKKPKDELLSIPQRWENDKTLRPVVHILRECFYENTKARPNALRLKKSIMSLSHEE